MAKKKPKKYWAGFFNGRLGNRTDYYSKTLILAIYYRRKDAEKCYEDVRPVEIGEIK